MPDADESGIQSSSQRKIVSVPAGPLKLSLCDDKQHGHHVHAIAEDSALRGCMGNVQICPDTIERAPIGLGDVIIRVC